ncbi:lysophospholipid acyltransferase LPEAT2 isoform X1 [Amborella trichopoda]|uniref:lysophospholipid acyltransferase LPEAT2 isoform X1 n=1 Tax=Amborella trichopoda TaxID=13333 RepID=UPI0005D32B92|nr:lysophospholipid acyltransferase LPEAT2 isoform X1 [Amborella trichopoda]|eukprot:XP_006828904.2 lysophospholipid acyltransferase LPEAT2 isoform X1 [Amborella trichopoda]
MEDLGAPLLSSTRGTEEAHLVLDINGGQQHSEMGEDRNPFDFLGANLSIDSPAPLDPFRNHTPHAQGLYEWVKILVCLPIVLLRLVIFGLSLLVGYVATKIALIGWTDRQNPMPRWRCRIMWVTRLCTRTILFSFGYNWIKRIGKPISREIAPIVVSNHVSYIEPIFFFYDLFPTIVASESHDDMPFVGTIIRAMQVIFVNRFSAPSRKHAVNEIKRKASCNSFPRVLLFPEGTTTNGRMLISFQLGAFIPGFPIQPVAVRYPYVHFDQSWGYISLARLMFRMFTQFHNFMEVEYLPVIFPLASKKESAVGLAERTSYAIASALNVIQTSHSYGDLMLLTRASELGLDKPSSYMVEMAKMERVFNMNTQEAVELLDKFFAMNPDPNGRVKIFDFVRVLTLGFNPLSEKIFRFLDVEQVGSITFRQFLFGSVTLLKQPSFRQACDTAYACCDGEGKGYIIKQEFEHAVQSACPYISVEDYGNLFELFDSHNNDKISHGDFLTCLRKNPLIIALFASQISICRTIEAQDGRQAEIMRP